MYQTPQFDALIEVTDGIEISYHRTGKIIEHFARNNAAARVTITVVAHFRCRKAPDISVDAALAPTRFISANHWRSADFVLLSVVQCDHLVADELVDLYGDPVAVLS